MSPQRFQLLITSIIVFILFWRNIDTIERNNYGLLLFEHVFNQTDASTIQSSSEQWELAVISSTICSRGLFPIGLQSFFNNKFVLAQTVLERYEKCQPNDVIALFWLGKTYQAQGDFAAANTAWRQANAVEYMRTMALAAEEHLDLQTSQEFYNLAIEIDETDCYSWAGYGRLLFQQKDYDEALVSYLKAVDLDCVDLELFIEIGDIFRIQYDFEKALDWYRKAALEFPTEPLPLLMEGITFYEQQEYSTAIEVFFQAKERKETADIYGWIGRTYTRLEETEEAIGAYNKAIGLNTKSIKYYLPLGLLYENKGEFALAKALYEQGLKFDPENQQLGERWRAIGEQEKLP